MTKTYSEKDIERFAGLAGIRKKPTPYIGPTDEAGLWTLWREPADNAVDRALAGDNDLVHLVEDPSGKYWVLDNGPGIPVGEKKFHNEHGKLETYSTLYVVTGLTHGGANFKGNTISRGTHGIGIKATNAMSKWFKVWTFRDGSWYSIEYKDAKVHKNVQKDTAPKLPHGIKPKSGTVVCFEPDLSLFQKKVKTVPLTYIQEWCKLTAYLVPRLKVCFTSKKGKTITLKTKGPAEYISKRLEELKATQLGKSFVFSSKTSDVAVAFTDQEGDNLVAAYTNGLHNKDGGEHVKALQDALFKSLKPFSKTSKDGKVKYTPSDLRDGLLGIVNFKISAPQFNNQPKDKLIDERVYDVAFKEFYDAWEAFWGKHKSMAKEVVARAETLRSKTADFLKDKRLIKNVKAAQKGVNSKLAGVVGSAPVERRELLLCEGDSAGGGLIRARDKSFQAVYPLRGKPLNVMEADKDKVNNNVEIMGILAALGVQLDGKAVGTIKYGRVILFADADVDGEHINTILLAALYKYVPNLFRSGNVFAIKSPLFKARYKDRVLFGMTKEEIYKQAGTNKVDITYLKGWGEVNESDLVHVALSPATRQLYKIMPSLGKSGKDFELLMGKRPDYRKTLLGITQ